MSTSPEVAVGGTSTGETTLSPPFTTLSWKSQNCDIIQQMQSAPDGVVLFHDLPLKVPMTSIRETFCKLYEETKIVEQLNTSLPVKDIFDNTAFFDKNQDQKISFNLTPQVIQFLLDYKHELIFSMGTEFMEVIEFINHVQANLIPRFIELASNVITGGSCSNETVLRKVQGIHWGMNYNFQFLDYLPIHRTFKRRTEERFDSTFALIFQDAIQGGFQVYRNETWTSVPVATELLFVWGWSAFILSNGRIPAPLHRVVPLKLSRYGKSPRRNEVIVHISPDMNAFLHPILLSPREALSFNIESVKHLTVEKFKALLRNQTLEENGSTNEAGVDIETCPLSTENPSLAQDSEVVNFLLGM